MRGFKIQAQTLQLPSKRKKASIFKTMTGVKERGETQTSLFAIILASIHYLAPNVNCCAHSKAVYGNEQQQIVRDSAVTHVINAKYRINNQ
jgi:hypothetical protein